MVRAHGRRVPRFRARRAAPVRSAFLIPSTTARRYPDDFLAGRSPAGAIYLELLGQAKAQDQIGDTEPIEIMITIAGLSQGLVTLYRAGRIAGGEDEFRALFRRAMRRCIQSYFTEKWA